MISDTIKRLETEIAALTVELQRAREIAFPRDLESELARLTFHLSQERVRKLAIHHNYLAICDRAGIIPYEYSENPYG